MHVVPNGLAFLVSQLLLFCSFGLYPLLVVLKLDFLLQEFVRVLFGLYDPMSVEASSQVAGVYDLFELSYLFLYLVYFCTDLRCLVPR